MIDLRAVVVGSRYIVTGFCSEGSWGWVAVETTVAFQTRPWHDRFSLNRWYPGALPPGWIEMGLQPEWSL